MCHAILIGAALFGSGVAKMRKYRVVVGLAGDETVLKQS
jgi:hypothetical protein